MTRDRDPLERLRRANPVPKGDAPGPDSPKAKADYQRIIASRDRERAPARRAWRRRTWILIPAIAIAAAAAGYGIFRNVTQPLVVTCYGAPSLQANRAAIQADPGTAAEACRALWRPGALLNPRSDPVPRLEACVLPNGGLGVFPQTAGDICSRLGLAHPDIDSRSSGRNSSLQRAQETLSDRFLAVCTGPGAAASFARQVLKDDDLPGWRVSAPSSFPDAQPCASVGFDLTRQVVNIIPVTDSP